MSRAEIDECMSAALLDAGKTLRMTKKRLARHLGVSDRTLRNWKSRAGNGRAAFGVEILVRMGGGDVSGRHARLADIREDLERIAAAFPRFFCTRGGATRLTDAARIFLEEQGTILAGVASLLKKIKPDTTSAVPGLGETLGATPSTTSIMGLLP